MTVLDCLRALVAAGVGLVPNGERLRLVYGRSAVRQPKYREMVVACKAELMTLMDPVAITRELGLPRTLTVTPTLAVALVWVAAEREMFTDDEQELWQERAAMREHEAGAPRWLAELFAIEDVVTLRAGKARD